MPVTFVTMTLGLAALVGVAPLSGFFSKEAVLGAAEETALHDGPVPAWAGWLVLVVGLLTVAVTAAYATRLWLMKFFDQPRGLVATHESSPAMRWPLIVLAVPTVVLGVAGLRAEWLPSWLGVEEHLQLSAVTSVVSTLLVVAGVAATVLAWRRDPAGDPSARLAGVRPTLVNAFYVDSFYDRAFVGPVRAATRAVRWTDDRVVDASASGSGRGALRAADWLRRTQAGNVQTYLTGLLAGIVVVAVGVVTLT
jgi:NADH-quinone oxidoreductase subunit L